MCQHRMDLLYQYQVVFSMRKSNLVLNIPLFVVVLLLGTGFYACDEIDPPYTTNQSGNVDTGTYLQKVLIEDFTGHRCGNCPRAHEKLEEISDLYPGKVIGVAIHNGFFATPLSPDYPMDYRTQAGDEIASEFGVDQWPIGMVNRTSTSGSPLIAYDGWATEVSQILANEPSISISIVNGYDTTSRQLTATVNATFLQSVDQPLRLSLFLTEDSIISPQTDYDCTPNKVDNYVHMHMLRTAINGTWGTNVSSGNKAEGDTLMRVFTTTLNSAWNYKHCSVVAFFYDETTNEILNVEKSGVID